MTGLTELIRGPVRALGLLPTVLLDPRRAVGERAGRALNAVTAGAVEALAARLLSEEVLDRLLTVAERTGIAQLLVDRLLQDGIVEQVAARVLSGPEAQRIVDEAFAGPLADRAVAQLLESEALWRLVDELARSTAVTEAIAHQGSGFAEQVTMRLRERSSAADTRLQRLADRLTPRRGPDAQPDAGSAA